MEVKLRRVNGVLKIDINGKIYEPLSFKSFRPTKENITQFANDGVKLFSILSIGFNCFYGIPYSLYGESWLGKGKYDLSTIDRQIDMFIENAPDSYFGLMFSIDTRDWWLASHENYPDSYGYISQMAYDTEWREAATEYMHTVISHVEEKYGEYIYGYYLLCGKTTEWLSDYDYQKSHPIKEQYFKDYTQDPNVKIPDKEQLELPADISFYDDKNAKIYHKAHAEIITDTILYFAAEAQKLLNHKKLLGVYYGYVLELSDDRLWNAGHMDYERVFNSPDIDIISSPASYEFRAPDSTSAFMVADKTLALSDKLYFFEFDQRTYLSKSRFEGIEIPPAGYHCKNDTEAVDLMRRDFMLCAANGAALWWFDMWNGWYNSEKMNSGIANMVQVSKRLSEINQNSAAEIAVFVSGKALYGVNKMSRLNTNLFDLQRGGLAKLGAPYDVYSLSDLPRVALDKYKMFAFFSAFETTKEEDEIIEKIKSMSDKTILWLYAPKYINGGLTETSKTVGMTLSITEEKPEYRGTCGVLLPSPYIYVADTEAKPIVCYEDGKCAVAKKKVNGNTYIYSSLGNLSDELLRSLARDAGVHIYSDNATVYVNNRLIGVYSLSDAVIHTRYDGIYEDLFSGKQYVSKNGVLHLPKEESASRLLLYIK